MSPQEAIERLADAEWELNAAWKQEDHLKRKFRPPETAEEREDPDRKFFNQTYNGPRLEEIRARVRAAKIARFQAFKVAVEAFLKVPLDKREQAAKSSNKLVRKVAKESLSANPLHTTIHVDIPTGVYLAMRDQGINVQALATQAVAEELHKHTAKGK